ncbi:hypothetical protein [Streptomyces sp. NBC_01483]|uniref:hypothetical protein n=1 Tax=Streptomyces sp. NBC_01483 TaxID=2903883 RepID=UPI002E303B49|nr:hypothetical protein [Streptomyces sp. NBC_01483]
MSYDQQYPHESELSPTAVQLNHTAIYARDRHLSAEFIAAILGLKVGAPFGPFLPVDLGNGVTLDYYEKRDEPIQSQHYAFLVPDENQEASVVGGGSYPAVCRSPARTTSVILSASARVKGCRLRLTYR